MLNYGPRFYREKQSGAPNRALSFIGSFIQNIALRLRKRKPEKVVTSDLRVMLAIRCPFRLFISEITKSAAGA
jgi:hypothetical protein